MKLKRRNQWGEVVQRAVQRVTQPWGVTQRGDALEQPVSTRRAYEYGLSHRDIFNGIGDCVRSCVATVFNLDWADVPNFEGIACVVERGEIQAHSLLRYFRQWGLEGESISLIEDPHNYGEEWRATRIDVSGIALAFAWLPGDMGLQDQAGGMEMGHCVVMQDGKLLWDPFPGGGLSSLGAVHYWTFPTRNGYRLKQPITLTTNRFLAQAQLRRFNEMAPNKQPGW